MMIDLRGKPESIGESRVYTGNPMTGLRVLVALQPPGQLSHGRGFDILVDDAETADYFAALFAQVATRLREGYGQ
jgi:hypothetical protein